MKTNEIIRQIAKERGISPKKVEEEMRYAIREAMANQRTTSAGVVETTCPGRKRTIY